MTNRTQTNQIEFKKVSELCDLRKGKKVKSFSIKTKDSVPYLLIDTLRGAEPEFFTEDKNYTEAIPDDILIVADGANSGLVGTGVKGAVGSTILRIRINVEDLDKDYLSYFLKSKFTEFNKDMKGTGIPHLKAQKMMELKLRKPSLSTQSLIVSAIETQFTRLDSAVKSLKSIKAKLEVYRKAVLKKAFEKKDGWEEKTLDEICEKNKSSIKAGPFGSSLKKDFYVKSGYKIYGQEQVIKNDAFFGDYYINKEKFESLKSCQVKPGDLLISLVGTIGKTLILPDNCEKGIINPRLIKISLDKSIANSKFINYYLKSLFVIEFLKNESHGQTMSVLNLKILKKLPFVIPHLEEQSLIVSAIEAKFSVIDKVEEIVNNSLKKAEMLRKSILKSAFEGKLVGEE
jgi:type I restriction enzyme, S subunit